MDGTTLVTAHENSSNPRIQPARKSRASIHRSSSATAKQGPALSAILGGAEPRRIPGGRIQSASEGRRKSLDPCQLQPIKGSDGKHSRAQVRDRTSRAQEMRDADTQEDGCDREKSQAVIEFNLDGHDHHGDENSADDGIPAG